MDVKVNIASFDSLQVADFLPTCFQLSSIICSRSEEFLHDPSDTFADINVDHNLERVTYLKIWLIKQGHYKCVFLFYIL